MSNYYAFLEAVNGKGEAFITQPQAFESKTDRDDWVREAPISEARGFEWWRIPVSESRAEVAICALGCTRHGLAEYTDEMEAHDDVEARYGATSAC